MIQTATDWNNLGDSGPILLRVLEEVATRRRNGEDFADDEVVAAHPNLMPQLGQMLSAMSRAETARRIASSLPDSAPSEFNPFVHPGRDDARVGRLERDMFRGYELGEVIGQGATGVVYRAIQSRTGREVAIKVLLHGTFESNSEESRFEREAHILAQIKHPNIVTVYDTGWSSGRFFLVMDYVRGLGLDQWLRETNPPFQEKLRVFAEIAETVHAAHLRGVIHRDLKPSNIRIDADGRPHLLDFGLAKLFDAVGSDTTDAPPAYTHSMTMTGQFVGSLPWASPEQAEGNPQKIDIRTDIYSLGVMMYHAMTGRFPYSVIGNIRDVIDRILTAVPPRPRALQSTIDDDAETIVLNCLNKERERRYQSAGELALDLRHRIAGEPIAARRTSGWYVIRTALRRHRVAFGVLIGVAVLTILYAATMSVLFSRARQDAERAQLTLTFLQDTLFQASSHRLGSEASMIQVLDEASNRLWNEFSMQPEVAAALHFTVGSAYDSIWRKDLAIRHLRRAMELNLEIYGLDHPDTLRSTTMLGTTLIELRSDESVTLLREALEAGRRHFGRQHVFVAETLGGLAHALWAAQKPPQWQDAQQAYQQSLAIFRDYGDAANPLRVRTMISLASMYRARNRSVEAESQYREACETASRYLGPTHQFTLECRLALSDVLVDLARFAEARELIDDVSPLAERQFGARIMPSILRRTVYAQIANQEFEAAEKTLFDVQAGVCERLARANPDQGDQLRLLAETLRAKTGRRGADAAYFDALDATQRIEPDPLESARALISLGTVRYRQERYVYAEKLLRRCLELVNSIDSPEYTLRSRASRMLSNSLLAQGRPAEAEEVLENALGILIESIGPNESITLQVADDLRLLYTRAGRTDEANALPARSDIPEPIEPRP